MNWCRHLRVGEEGGSLGMFFVFVSFFDLCSCSTADTLIGEAGAKELALALKENTTLQSLNQDCESVIYLLVWCVLF